MEEQSAQDLISGRVLYNNVEDASVQAYKIAKDLVYGEHQIDRMNYKTFEHIISLPGVIDQAAFHMVEMLDQQ